MQRVGPYQVRGELARGAAGVVFRAWDDGLGREVALKLLRRGVEAGDAERRRFRREAEALARIRHRNVVRVHAAGEHDGAPYLVMELIEGETLQARLDRDGPLPPREAAQLIQRLARGLAAAHRAGILHRDIKPDNVLLSRGAREPLLTDFGLAKDLSATQSRSRLSIRGRFLGTPGYWPPEQASGELEQMGPASDVYALGATLWATLVGRPPLEASSLVEALVATQERRPDPPSRHAPAVGAALDLIALGCLEKSPALRYPGAEPLAEDLERYLRGQPVVGPGAPVQTPLPRPRLELPRPALPGLTALRGPWLAWAGWSAALCGVGLGLGALAARALPGEAPAAPALEAPPVAAAADLSTALASIDQAAQRARMLPAGGARAQALADCLAQAQALCAAHPGSGKAWLLAARVAEEQGRLADQARSGRRAWESAPLEPAGLLLWAEALLELEPLPEERRQALEALGGPALGGPALGGPALGGPAPELLATRARLRLPRQGWQVDPLRPADPRARAEADQALALAPRSPRALLAQAEVLLHSGEVGDALVHARLAAQEGPRSYLAWRLLSALEPPGARRKAALEQALERVGQRGDAVCARLELSLAAEHLEGGDRARGFELGREAVARLPRDAGLRVELTRLVLRGWEPLFDGGEPSVLALLLSEALRADPEHPELLLMQAWLRTSRSEIAGAQADLERLDRALAAGRGGVDPSELSFVRARVLYGAGRYEESEALLAGLLQTAPSDHPLRRDAQRLLDSVDQRLRGR